jgi:hypothetical protein
MSARKHKHDPLTPYTRGISSDSTFCFRAQGLPCEALPVAEGNGTQNLARAVIATPN